MKLMVWVFWIIADLPQKFVKEGKQAKYTPNPNNVFEWK
jgi:hypothetical protein